MGILDSIGSFLGDEENRLKLASGFAGMSGNPNAGNIQQGYQNRLTALGNEKKLKAKTDLAASQANATFTALRAAGISEEVLAVARTNPDLAKSITTDFLKAKMGVGFMPKYNGGLQTDPSTGQQYVVKSDPNTGESTRINVDGAIQQTPQQGVDMESDASVKLQDIQKAQEVGQQAFGQMEAMQIVIGDLQNAKKMVVEGGASTGIMEQWIPSFDAATSEFRAIANRLGIAVINSATFGALSEKELQLAMETGFPRSLQGPELIKWIDAKISAQTKMKNALYSKARSLTSGIRYSEFIQAHGYKDGNNPNGAALTPAQQELKNRGL